uniref:RRM domain-containing protein n=1 Tax=Eutreptiella gymnastica TaxID=73025 RepID=A0A7S1NCR1_9EUGL|mmetsp:Transcript_15926/g.28208  ORF Transcript_15926/g.28208 Transcript_15926/m.28208 type:complete len:311 (+) Transcript_15926:33-965(+)
MAMRFGAKGGAKGGRYAPYPRAAGRGRTFTVNLPDRGAVEVGTRVYVGNLNFTTSWQNLKDFGKTIGEVLHADIMTNKEGRPSGSGILEFSDAMYAADAMLHLNGAELDGRTVFVREDREDKVLKAAVGGQADRPLRRETFEPRYEPAYEPRYKEPARAEQIRDEPMDPQSYAKWYREWKRENSQVYGTAEYLSRYERERTPPLEIMSKGKGFGKGGGGKGGGKGGATGGTRVFVGNLPFAVSWQDLKDVFRNNGFDDVHVAISQDETGRSRGHAIVTFTNARAAADAVRSLHDYPLQGRLMDVHFDKFS